MRDGGYVNDWKFGYNNIISIFERLVDANVDVIEIGFLDDRRPLILIELLCRIPIVLKKYLAAMIKRV